MKRVHIDELERVPLPHVTFRPVRRRLGLSGFSANADSAGDYARAYEIASAGLAGSRGQTPWHS